jgi:hypothetical protein
MTMYKILIISPLFYLIPLIPLFIPFGWLFVDFTQQATVFGIIFVSEFDSYGMTTAKTQGESSLLLLNNLLKII